MDDRQPWFLETGTLDVVIPSPYDRCQAQESPPRPAALRPQRISVLFCMFATALPTNV
ncbi:hypothetical protein Stsp01_66870 [Streptomyces sp. NBRC 13847]|nr:hypothetical protein Stsp01_66870 [Streptomyces sp. NBRC 13847]